MKCINWKRILMPPVTTGMSLSIVDTEVVFA